MPFDASGFISWAFFAFIFEVVNSNIESFQDAMLGRTMQWVSSVVFMLLSLWVFFQGFMIVTGRSRESLMGLVVGTYSSVFAATPLLTYFQVKWPMSRVKKERVVRSADDSGAVV